MEEEESRGVTLCVRPPLGRCVVRFPARAVESWGNSPPARQNGSNGTRWLQKGTSSGEQRARGREGGLGGAGAEQRAPLINEVFSPKCFVCLALPASTFSFSGLCFPLPQTELRKKKKKEAKFCVTPQSFAC